MSLLQQFLDPSRTSLKVCGLTTASDAQLLLDLGVEALGVNFWPRSKRYLNPELASWLVPLAGKILRVGVFVNPDPAESLDLVRQGFIDVVQLHGDENPDDALPYLDAGVPFIKAIGVRNANDTHLASRFGANAVLLDAHAPGVYGGTGATFNWNDALAFHSKYPEIPFLLAGGITPENALQACRNVRPAALDVASGSESAPGVKDANKIRVLLDATMRVNRS